MENKKNNPKYIEALKRGKVDYSTIPWPVIQLLAQAMMEGAGKYGRFNYRKDDIEARTYIAAIGRHLFGDPSTGSKGWVNGEDIDEESGLPHLVKVMACCLLVEDARMHGKLIDNRLEAESITPPSAREDATAAETVTGARTFDDVEPIKWGVAFRKMGPDGEIGPPLTNPVFNSYHEAEQRANALRKTYPESIVSVLPIYKFSA